jgi:uncharacterized protein (DUF1800 family)
MNLRVLMVGACLVSLGSCTALAQSGPTAAKSGTKHAKAAKPAVTKPVVLTPLTQRERVVQLLDRFTFGPRPGEVDRVLAEGGDKWLDEQLNPDAIKDAELERRLGAYPTVGMSSAQALATFPDRPQIAAVAKEQVQAPTDPLLNAVYEVQLFKWNREQDQKKVDGSAQPRPEPTDEQKAAQRKVDQATAARIAGALFALPKNERMAALIKMPVEDRIAFTGNGNLSGDQRNLLLNDFAPREREAFNAMAAQVSSSYNIGSELAQARVLRDVMSERQLQQVMTDFWFNHFNVFIGKDSDQWYTTAYERDVIRKHALGTFPELLLATAMSPAMMVYLDNYQSIGPDSLANGVNPANPKSKKGNRGLNENYGREVMELHTVGVNGGYTQADVTALSAILTGWGVDQPNDGGGFVFDPRRHEPGTKIWFGYSITEDGQVTKLAAGVKASGPGFGASSTVATAESVKQGIAALEILANSPQTAHFISYKLAQYFVADEPPAALVDRLAGTYVASKGDIKTMLRAIAESPEFNSRQYFRNKVKTPEEFIASAFRTSATDPQNPGAMVGAIKNMGMELYRALPPTGYYLTADQWMSSTALVDRLNFAYALTNGKFANQKFDAPKLLAMGLLGPSDSEWMKLGGMKTVNESPTATRGRLLGVAAPVADPAGGAVSSVGPQIAMRVLETTMIGAPVSAGTNGLIEKQLAQQPAGASAIDTLNVMAALVMGSPEFQMH